MHEAPVKPLDLIRNATARVDVLDSASDRRFLALANLKESRAFPLTLSVRGLVTGRRELPEPCLEILPEGYGLRALNTLGPLLVPCERDLEPGSVVTARVQLLPPDRYVVQPAGLLACPLSLHVELAVER